MQQQIGKPNVEIICTHCSNDNLSLYSRLGGSRVEPTRGHPSGAALARPLYCYYRTSVCECQYFLPKYERKIASHTYSSNVTNPSIYANQTKAKCRLKRSSSTSVLPKRGAPPALS